jgi:hypothetical protein
VHGGRYDLAVDSSLCPTLRPMAPAPSVMAPSDGAFGKVKRGERPFKEETGLGRGGAGGGARSLSAAEGTEPSPAPVCAGPLIWGFLAPER